MKLRRNGVDWELPDEEVTAKFLNSPIANAVDRTRSPRLAATLGEFLAAKHSKGGLQSVPLVHDVDDSRSFGRVINAIVDARPDWKGVSARSFAAAARRAADAAARAIDGRKAMAAHIRAAVDAAPPLTPDVIAKLRRLLPPVSAETYQAQRAAEATRVAHLARLIRNGRCRIVGGTGPVRLWWDGMAEYGWELSEADLADRFISSRFGDRDRWPQPVDQVLACFVAAHEDDDGLQSDWLIGLTAPDAATHQRVVDLIGRRQRRAVRPLARSAKPPVMAAQRRASVPSTRSAAKTATSSRETTAG